MNIYAALSLFSVVILVYWIISELFTILFRFTGLPEERARFQVISLLTGCGFTTRESELFLSSRSRRRMARITMLFGYVFNITIVSAFINVFFSLKLNQAEHYYLGMLIPLLAVALIIVFMRFATVRRRIDRQLARFADLMLHKRDSSNSVLLLDYIGKDSIAQVKLKTVPEELRDLSLARSGLKAERGILVLLVERAGSKAEPASAETVFRDGDKLTVFGDYDAICATFNAREHFSD